jgi:hypothetical protein
LLRSAPPWRRLLVVIRRRTIDGCAKIKAFIFKGLQWRTGLVIRNLGNTAYRLKAFVP